jgi:hypothetical protein
VGSLALAVAVVAGLAAPARSGGGPTGTAAASEQYGKVQFPRDEHVHPDGWDFWWGAANIVTTAGNSYTLAVAHDALNGVGVSGHELFPRQGPYEGRTVASQDGPAEWGHEGEITGRYQRVMSVYAPGVSELVRYETLDTFAAGKRIGLWERTSLADHAYHLVLDNDAAMVHPSRQFVRLGVDLHVTMQDPPLLAGGDGQFWYGIPETFGYPSRSFQYVQVSDTIAGTLEVGQPDGSVLRETIDPAASNLLMVREYDASPEDLPAGLAIAESHQLHPRYAPYYQGGMPWELLFVDLRNGAQLMLAVMAFHDSNEAVAPSITGKKAPEYEVLATLRLPGGRSIPLDDDQLRVEHLSYRRSVGRVPTFWVTVKGIWEQGWDYRISHPGGTVDGPDGPVVIPSFDIGLAPHFEKNEPIEDARGNRNHQRVSFEASGVYGGCPVHGFGFSELIINWYGHESQDPWFTGGDPPRVPRRCTQRPVRPNAPAATTPAADRDPQLAPEGCQAVSGTPCTYVATAHAGISGFGAEPGGWRVEITRAGEPAAIVVTSHGDWEFLACGAIRPGDSVTATADEGSFATVGNPGVCF